MDQAQGNISKKRFFLKSKELPHSEEDRVMCKEAIKTLCLNHLMSAQGPVLINHNFFQLQEIYQEL
jgi:hypothetical protein